MGIIGYEERDSWEWIRDGLVRRKSVRTAPSKKRDYIQIQRVLADADQKSDAPHGLRPAGARPASQRDAGAVNRAPVGRPHRS